MEEFTPEALVAALQSCENEAIHQIGRIQSHGGLIVLDVAPERIVLQVSENISSFFETTPESALGHPLRELISLDQAAELEAVFSLNGEGRVSSHLIYSVVDNEVLQLQTSIHQVDGLLLLELEPIRKAYTIRDMHDLFNPVRTGLWALDSATEIAGYCRVAADLVRELVGFDRVMVYRFDQNWEGEAIAESRVATATSYLGNRFPAGDIPPQARHLYTRNLIRIVADTEARPVSILPRMNPLTGMSLDLSLSVLRAFAPVHVEYLGNMGVRASLSISILLDGKLWGLIACHHGQPAFVPQPAREMLEFVGKIISMKLSALDAGERIAQGSRLGDVMTPLIKGIYSGDDPVQTIRQYGDQILGLVEASGAILIIDGHRQSMGLVPDDGQVDQLLSWLASCSPCESLASDHLVSLYPAAEAYAGVGAGLLATPVTSEMRSAVLWFRTEKIRSVTWAGKPDKELLKDASGQLRISPRKSFAAWSETWRSRSPAWARGQIAAGTVLAEALVEAVTQKGLKQREEFYRLFGDQTPEMISRHALDGRFTFASPSAQIVLGIPPEQLLGCSLVDQIDEVDRGDFADLFATACEQTSSGVFRMCRADGGAIWLEASVKRIVLPDGSCELMAISRDVTERQKYQLAVEEFQQLNLSLLEAGSEGILAIDSDGMVSYANTVACDLLNWPLSELIGRHAHDTVHHSRPDGSPYPELECSSRAVLRDGILSLCHDDCYFLRDGSALKVVTATTPIINHGKITGAVVVFIRARSGEAMSPLNSREEVGAIMTMDREGHITSFSDSLSRLTGYSIDDVVGQRSSLLKSNVHTRSFFREMWRRVQHDKHWRGLIWNRCKDGSIRPFWVSINTVCDKHGGVDQYLAVYGETTARSSPEARLHFLASHDNLTGLPNRSHLSNRLHQAVARAARLGTRIAIAFIDLDRFKEINDQLGHGAGDQLLIELARRLQDNCRQEDTISRWGGDEFLVLMEDVLEPGTPAQLAGRMLAALCAPVTLGAQSVVPAASVGIAVFPDDAQSTAALIEAADMAMYRAKKDGRNRVVAYRQISPACLPAEPASCL